MSYALKADIQKRLDDEKLIQLTDVLNTRQMDDAKITECLDNATGQIDSYVGGKYSLPLVASAQVKKLCVDIAIFYLYELRGLTKSDAVADSYMRAMDLLKDVAAGRASLDQPSKTQATAMGATTKDHATDPDLFGKENMGDW